MQSLARYLATPSPCGYLPEEAWQLEYECVQSATAEEYMQRMTEGWRRFGRMLFHPACPRCEACKSIRVVVDRFRPNRSQRRCQQRNEGLIRLRISEPEITRAKLDLYDRFHAFQTEIKGWPWHPPKDTESFFHSFVDNPFPTEEWCYFLDSKLIGLGYVDNLSGGLSAIYFVHDPAYRKHALGTWNVLSILKEARQRQRPHVYLGYYVVGCPSMEYKSHFVPNQIRHPDGIWRDFLE